MTFNRELHAAITVDGICSTEVIQKCNMIPIDFSNREQRLSMEGDNYFKVTGKIILNHITVLPPKQQKQQTK